MAELILSAVVPVLIEKLVDGSSDLMKLARYEGIDSQLKKWTKKLTLIHAVLADAGQKHTTQNAVRLWLQELQDLAYDIDDVLDDMATEVIKPRLDQASTSTSSKLLKLFPACCTNLTPHNMIYGHNMSSKLDEITSRLNDLADQKNNLGLLDVHVNVEIRSDQQTSLVKSTVFGREAEKEALLAKLTEDEALNQKVIVMSIFGMGGIGKTTLAQLLYNDEKVNATFELKAWVCVSEKFDVFNISKGIYQAVAGEDKAFANLDLLHVALKEKLSKKRFLVVLDDVWNEDRKQWELLKGPFVDGPPGSKIIVTTRNEKVASVMDSVKPYNLEVLTEEIAVSLFASNALNEENFEKYPSLQVIAEGIIKKCDGLPLALVTLGKVLKAKGTNEDEWEELLNSEIWDIDDGSGILPALKLSYYDLPLHLKQLFAYCCLFPKDYIFNKDELVLLWMAEGFLSHSKGSNKMENLGRRYFEELRSRSFFQPSPYDESKYIMHDLMNDLAINVAGEFFFMLDDNMDVNGRKVAFEKFRHFSFIGQRGAEYRKLKELSRSSRLRTFFPVSIGWKDFDKLDHVIVELLPRLQFLRVLSLTKNSITKVPQSIGGLKHLRYLNFSSTSIKQVPEEVSELYNLQSLLVHYCEELSRLPDTFAKLINLRHFDNGNTPLLETNPLGIGRLTSLQTLSKVNIKDANGFKISELKDLVDLQGKISIFGLEKVKDPQEAKDANLEGKKGLVSLDMEWSDVFDDSRNVQTEYEVFVRLRPHTKVKKLNIVCYGGMEFPSWLGDPSFDKLTELRLKGCRNCTHFNGIAFPSLEYLKISDMEGLERCSNCDGDNDTTTGSFPHLRELHIKNCPKLAEVSIGSKNMKSVIREVSLKRCNSLKSYYCPNSIEMLEIDECSSMTSLTLSTTLQELFVEKCEKLVSISMGEKEEVNVNVNVNVGSSSSSMGMGSVLRRVVLWKCDSLESYNCPNSVETLEIKECSSMTSLTLSTTLQELDVRECKKLVSISMGEKEEVNVNVNVGMGSVLREVSLEYCDSLETYNCPNSVERLTIFACDSMTSLQELPSSLKSLGITGCRNLKSFPHEHLQSFTSLEELAIYNCGSMDDSFPRGLWPPNLRKLEIGILKKPMSEWGLQNYPPSLVELTLDGENNSRGVTSFAMEGDASNPSSSSTSFLLPPSLTTLKIWDFEEVESISKVLQHLTHLQRLQIISCPNIDDVPQSTSSLEVSVHKG